MNLLSEQTIEQLRQHAHENEEQGIINQQMLDVIYEKGLFKLFVPEIYGGKELSFPEALRTFEEASRINGSFGWLVTIGSGGGYFVSCFPDTVAKELFSSQQAVVAGSGQATGKARMVDGGYRVSGSWKYCSGSPFATMFTANAMIEEDEAESEPQMRSFVFMPEQVKIIKDWHAFGLKATASHTIQVEDVFVPERRTFLVMNNEFHSHPIYRYSFVPFAVGSFTAVCLGISRYFIEAAYTMTARKSGEWNESNDKRREKVWQEIQTGEQTIQSCINEFYEVIEHSWNRHLASESSISDEDWNQVSSHCQQTARTVLTVVQRIFAYLGIDAVMEHHPVNQAYRDLQTVCHHTLLVDFN